MAVFSTDLIRVNAIGVNESNRDDLADYYLGLDTSTTGNNYCCLTVIKYKHSKYSMVDVYRKRQQTSEYHLYHIGQYIKKYKPRKVGIEVTGGVGQVYLEQLTREFKDIDFQAIRTTGDSKPTMVSTMVLAMEQGKFIYPDNSPIIDEMLSFRREGNKLEAAPGKHDDMIMGVCFALAVSPFNKEKIGFQLHKSSRI